MKCNFKKSLISLFESKRKKEADEQNRRYTNSKVENIPKVVKPAGLFIFFCQEFDKIEINCDLNRRKLLTHF